MAKVFIMDNSRHTGHAALELDNGRYASFHPKTQSTLGPVVRSYPARWSESLAEDLEGSGDGRTSGYELTDTIWLNGLKEEAMEHALDHMQTDKRYQLFTMNCATVVAKLLIVGAGEKILTDHVSITEWKLSEHAKQFFRKRSENLHGRLTEHALGIAESAVLSIIRTMAAESSRGGRARRQPILPLVTTAILAADVLARDAMWTPGGVQHFAEHIKENLDDHGGGGGFGGGRSRW